MTSDAKANKAGTGIQESPNTIWGNRRLMLLVGGELIGALGFEAFNINVVWHLVKAMGANGAYYLAMILAGGIVSGIAGAGVFDRFRPFITVAALNSVRVVAAFAAMLAIVNGWPLAVLAATSLCMSFVRPHADAAIYSGVATLGLNEIAQQKANALVDNTARMARILGPAMAATMAAWANEAIALCFACLAFCTGAVALFMLDRITHGAKRDASQPGAARPPFFAAVTRGFRLAAASPSLRFCFFSQTVAAGAWYLGFVFSVALLFSSQGGSHGSGLGGFGMAALFYGVGNVTGNLVTGSVSIKRPMHFLVAGRMLGAVGYLVMSCDLGHAVLFAAAALCAAGIPPADLSFLKEIQSHFASSDVAKLIRVKLVAEYGGMLVAMLGAPFLLKLFDVHGVIATCGLALLGCAAVGLAFISRHGPHMVAEGRAWAGEAPSVLP